MPKAPPAGSPLWKAWEAFTRGHLALFRLTGGRLGGTYGGAPVLLLHHVGAKSGRKRVSPVVYVSNGDELAIVASKGGSERHPAWFHNLRANPDTVVELPRKGRRRVRARVLEGEERARWWERAVAAYKPYADYQTYTDRQIPIVRLEVPGGGPLD